MLVTSVVSSNSLIWASNITVGGSSQSGYQYIGDCSYPDLKCSELLVDNFMEEMEKYGDAEVIFNYSDESAWEQDVKPGSWKYDSIDDVNFMIYCGHGVKKGTKKFQRNSLHYFTENSFTSFHLSDDDSERIGSSNLTTTEAKWGKVGTETKWVALFSCNFLNEDDAFCTGMMQGINICMGFSTTMYVYADQGYTFGYQNAF